MRILRVGHINVSVDDVARARSFYEDVLNLEPMPRPADAGREGCWFRVGDVELHVSLEREADNASSKRHFAVEIDDVEAARAALTRAGAPIEEGRPLPGVDRFFTRDPAGNRIELYVRRPR